jgi:hypothetical protein
MISSGKMLEGDYQRALLARVAIEFRQYRFFRRNVGLIKMSNDRMFRASIPGQCDLYVIGRGGWHGEVEIKRYGKLTPEQMAWRDWCVAWQVPWLLLSVEKTEKPTTAIARWVGILRPWLVG